MATLPEIPKGKELEECISAILQSGGYFIEKNIIEREEGTEVLELDVVATEYMTAEPVSSFVEVKSGDWGFKDLFKIRGWLDYLEYERGLFITDRPKDNPEYFREKAQKIGIELIQVPDWKHASSTLAETMTIVELSADDVIAWRFSYWIERRLLETLKKWKKRYHGDFKCYQVLDEYYFLINSRILFTDNIVERLYSLYEAYKQHPRLTARCGNEILGSSFEDDVDVLSADLFKKTYYSCEFNVIQISTFIEHRARLALLKCTVDYLIKRRKKEERTKRSFGLSYEEMLLHDLPASFKKGLDSLEAQPSFHRYPVFWQWYLWLFGGFILKDYQEGEYELLSVKSGVPVDDIPQALNAFQILFPTDGGWEIDLSPESDIRLLKMASVPFCGVGAFYRLLLHEAEEYKELVLPGRHTRDDLIKWNNLSAKLLEDDVA
jgi:hypothetical protein